MSPKIVIEPADLRHAAQIYRAAGTKLGEVRTRLGASPPEMPADLLASVKTAIDRSVRDLDEQIAHIPAEALSLEARASLAEQADAASLLAQWDALGLVPTLGEQPPPDRALPFVGPLPAGRPRAGANGAPAALSPNPYENVVPMSYLDWSRLAGGNTCPQGGGVIRGPDGQLYAIVTKDALRDSGRPAFRNPGDIDGALPGSVIPGPAGSVSGVGPATAQSDRWAHALIGSTGASPPYGGYIRVTDPYTGETSVADVRSAAANVYPTFTPPASYWPSTPPEELHGRPPSSLGRAGIVGSNVLAFVNGALAGIEAGQATGNQRTWGYQVDYYQTSDGGRRARLNMYQVHYDAGGQRFVTNALGHFDANGNIVVDEPRVTTKVR